VKVFDFSVFLVHLPNREQVEEWGEMVEMAFSHTIRGNCPETKRSKMF
jgi:hypothetical protein